MSIKLQRYNPPSNKHETVPTAPRGGGHMMQRGFPPFPPQPPHQPPPMMRPPPQNPPPQQPKQ